MTAEESGAENGSGRGRPAGRRIFELRRWQSAIVGAVALTIVVVNKAMIHDQGNSWLSLAVVAFYVGLATAHVVGWLGRKLHARY